MKFRTGATLLTIALLASGMSRADEKTAPAALKQFETLKKLVGDWVEVGKDGKPTNKVISSIRLTSAGTAIHETLLPGSNHEMVTMYFLDGDSLVLTHYCALGNQPHMRAEPGKQANQIAFKFIGGTNLKNDNAHHMHSATLTILGPDHFKSEWVSHMDGKTCHQVSFDLVRKQK
jgi:hypothetical protein